MQSLLRKRRFFAFAFILLTIALSLLGGQRLLFIEHLERLALDWRIKDIGFEGAPPKIIVVQGGEESLQQLGAWPWPRTIHAALLGKLAHSRLILVDILFPEPSTSVADQALADVTKTLGNVVVSMHFAPAGNNAPAAAIPPYPQLAEAALALGVTNIDEDIDGLIRFHTPVRLAHDKAYPSLALAGAMQLAGHVPALEETDDALALVFGQRTLPLSQLGELPVDLSRPTFPVYELADVVTGKVDPDVFQDAVVMVGIGASGAEDFHVVPNGLSKRILDGSQYNAMCLETILSGRIPARLPANQAMLVIVILVLLGGLSALPRHPLAGAFCFVTIATAYLFANISIFKHSLLWIDLAYPLLALGTGHIVTAFVRYAVLHRDWRLKTYSLSSLYSLEAASKDHASLGDFLQEVWPQFKAGSGVDLLIAQSSLEGTPTEMQDAVNMDLTEAKVARVVIFRSKSRSHPRKMALPVPSGDGTDTFHYTLLGWKGRLAEDTSRTLAVTILSAAWFYRTLSRGRERRKQLTETIRAIFRALDFRDPITGGHSDRVASLAMEILNEMQLDTETKEDIYLGAMIHDIGKIGIPDSVLGKPDKLTGEEFGLILKHPAIGSKIMNDVTLPELSKRAMAEHHERFDGSGYPQGIAGEQLSLGARIVAVADVFDALRSDRPYRKGLSISQVCDYISEGSGSKYDPQVVDIVLRLKAPVDWKAGTPPPMMKGESKDEH